MILKGLNGALGGTRTPDTLVRSQVLYPAELRAQWGVDEHFIYFWSVYAGGRPEWWAV